MIELHHKIVESIRININYIDSIDPKNDENHIAFKESLGRLLHNKYKRLADIESDGVPFVGVYTQNIEGRAALKAILSWITEDDNAITSKNKYIFIQKNANGILGHYFRNLYQIIKLIDDHPDLNKSQRKKYSNIARAQLSQEELCLLLLNCLEDVVDDGSFADLLIKWEILEHIQLQKDPTKEIWKIKQGGAICTTSDITHYKSKKPTEKSTYTPRGAFGKNPDIG